MQIKLFLFIIQILIIFLQIQSTFQDLPVHCLKHEVLNIIIYIQSNFFTTYKNNPRL